MHCQRPLRDRGGGKRRPLIVVQPTNLAFKIWLGEPAVSRDPSFGFCQGIKFTEVTGGLPRPRHLHAPMTAGHDWLHYNAGAAPSHKLRYARLVLGWQLGQQEAAGGHGCF